MASFLTTKPAIFTKTGMYAVRWIIGYRSESSCGKTATLYL
ncbi:MAG TPA: hypothetical protein VMY99_02770 [Nevskiaceae bacterium]|nr:hypothetical protein [Nevskiaceae bacterium]